MIGGQALSDVHKLRAQPTRPILGYYEEIGDVGRRFRVRGLRRPGRIAPFQHDVADRSLSVPGEEINVLACLQQLEAFAVQL